MSDFDYESLMRQALAATPPADTAADDNNPYVELMQNYKETLTAARAMRAMDPNAIAVRVPDEKRAYLTQRFRAGAGRDPMPGELDRLYGQLVAGQKSNGGE